ncbi:hydrogenase 4 subunit B [Rhizobium multihospitium]|uniref:Formate hydrogenlyase subunit 3/Multisubunit Na+/H+ antiporter, MnhD subunit n=1 Tax=Rhizobium multihospitium TaxID=410764 RepID=A0A1C3WWB3_9HYPH|nr:hydrogenase 4 subunit B [Rhizobium multihospitium]SCB44292.1 Formate hydrogenlyase subunit 3/Multisubunit Na+/H+ antiporter, MnhD subunit [Rhizobium multihospitium]
MISPAAILLCSVFLLATAVLAVCIARSKQATTLTYGLSFGLSAIAFAVAIGALATVVSPNSASTLVLPIGLPWLGSHFRLDALSAFFLTVVNFGGMLSSLYALGYGRHEHAPHRVLPFFPAFVAGMNLVILADDAFTFLMSWEFMSLASWALVMAHHRDTGNRKAGYLYIVMASFGTLALLLAFGLLAGSDGNYGFATMRAAEHAPLTSALVLVLLLLGAGSKAGLVPLHVWLPRAHPAAPSHVSALMSGVMTKVAVYGFIRVIFDLVGAPAWWFGIVVLAIGGITAVLGILHALMESDLKRLLAYSTIENIGVIFVSLGLALAFKASGMGLAAALALTAALFHVLNHSFFKSLLFFGAGAVLTATGERDMEKLGGLIHRMPVTGLVFLVGCVAISALPPFNGFVSEWLAFQAVLQSPALPQWGLKLLVPAVGGLLALAAALAAACFVKVFGVTFLGRARSLPAERAMEVDRFSLAAMSVLAFLCLAAGILPGVVIDALAPLTLLLIGQRMPVQTDIPWLSIVPIAEARSSYNGLLVFLFILFSASFTAYLVHRFGSRRIRRAPAWDCGFPVSSPATQYSASSFAQPIRRVFGTLIFRARDRVTMPPPGDLRPARFALEMHDYIWEGLYLPIVGAVGFAAEKLNHLQFLTIRRYLSLVFITLVLLLLVLALWS